jgi:hypothetical protein
MPWALFHSLPKMEGTPVRRLHEEDFPRDMARRDAFIHMDVVEEEERRAELRVGGGRLWLGMAVSSQEEDKDTCSSCSPAPIRASLKASWLLLLSAR